MTNTKILTLFILSLILKNIELKYVDTEESIKFNCDSLNNSASKFYHTNFVQSKIDFNKAASCYLANQNSKAASYCFLNIATLLEENNFNLDSSILYSNLSLAVSLDSFHQANINKYLGYLYGKKAEYNISLIYFNNAIKLYESLNYTPGLNVTYFNLAQVKYMQNDFVNSKFYLDNSISFWKSKCNDQRLFTNNTLGIKIGISIQDTVLTKKYIFENDSIILKNIKLERNVIDSFLLYKDIFYKKIGIKN